jgi:cellulose synthase/poly-beta-1,6-N-acetylglucosamine synthase-like glycosyltransferase
MKKLSIFLFLVFCSFVGGVAVVRCNSLQLTSDKTPTPKAPVVEACFLPTNYPLQNRSFTVIVVGRNNGASVQRTLTSIFTQNYENFRIVYVDDASDDGTFELAQDLIYDMKYLIPTTLTRNEEPLGLLENLSRTIQNCANEEIVVLVDGHDWLAHEWVLQKLNQYYADPDLWITYGQFRNYPTFELGNSQLNQNQGKVIRKSSLQGLHLQTFYAALFKKIKPADLMNQGKYFPCPTSLAYMAPMLEMGARHFQYIPDTLYIADPKMGAPFDLEEEMRQLNSLRSLPPYDPLQALFSTSSLEEK